MVTLPVNEFAGVTLEGKKILDEYLVIAASYQAYDNRELCNECQSIPFEIERKCLCIERRSG
jgi:hypothetical protein